MEDTKERLLAAAGEIFGNKGYEAATVREISQLAGANLAAINYYFGDKERLYIESVKRAFTLRAEQVPLPDWSDDTPATAKLQGFISTMVARMQGSPTIPWHVKLTMRELLHPTAACAELVRDYIQPHFQILQSILAELLPANADPAHRHMIGFSIIGQCMYFRLARPIIPHLVGEQEFHSYTPERIAEHIVAFTFASLGISTEVST